MQHAFNKLFVLLNTVLNFADQDTLLHNVCNQAFEVVEDIHNAYSRKQEVIKDREARIESIKEEVRIAQDNAERTQNLVDFLKGKSSKKTKEIRDLKKEIQELTKQNENLMEESEYFRRKYLNEKGSPQSLGDLKGLREFKEEMEDMEEEETKKNTYILIEWPEAQKYHGNEDVIHITKEDTGGHVLVPIDKM